jgi:tRNA dimethylallyltransferase
MVGLGEYNAIVLLGATATGKTALGVHLARTFAGEIISADSRQVYRGLDIGSGKDLVEYGEVPYHLVDIESLSREYSVFDFQRDFKATFAEIRSRGKLPIVVGGTGMYLDSVIRNYDFPEVPVNDRLRASLEGLSLDELATHLLSLKGSVHNKTDLVERSRLVRAIEIAEYKKDRAGAEPGSEQRITDLAPLVMGIRFERATLRSRIRERLVSRLDAGLVEEVQALRDTGTDWERLERLGLEYRFTAEYLQGKIPSMNEYRESLYTAICQFAKRQETWFRGMERKGVAIHWVENGNRDTAVSLASRFFRKITV